jgi:hypothetical protein
MEFGGRIVYDGAGYADAVACDGGVISRGPGTGTFRVVGWMKRFALIFATVAPLTPFCTILGDNWPMSM